MNRPNPDMHLYPSWMRAPRNTCTRFGGSSSHPFVVFFTALLEVLGAFDFRAFFRLGAPKHGVAPPWENGNGHISTRGIEHAMEHFSKAVDLARAERIPTFFMPALK